MTQNIRNRYNELRDETRALIVEYIKENGCGDIHNSEEEYYELPRTFHVDKYGFHNEYAILGARIEDNKMIFDGFGLSDAMHGHGIEFYDYEIGLHTMLEVVDELYKIPSIGNIKKENIIP